MTNVRCPGQDRSFWKPDDIYNVTCARCGAPVEFFRTDGFRICPSCGGCISNPRLAMGCAQWCEHAVACLGYDPRQTEYHAAAARPTGHRLLEKLEALHKSRSPSGDDKR